MGGIEDAGPVIWDGGSAFPGMRRHSGADVQEEGCTKRELFAAIVATGVLRSGVGVGLSNEEAAEAVADQSFKLADALLKRSRRP